MHNWRDLQSILYLLALPAIVMWQWQFGFNWSLYLLELFLTLGIGVIHHNHTHLRIWKKKLLNRLTDLWISALQGHPTFVFYPAHIANHHRYRHSEQDVARTYRFKAGFNALGRLSAPETSHDSNNLLGYVLHPLQASWVLYPQFIYYMKTWFRQHRAYFYYCLLQYALVISLWVLLAFIDWRKWLLFVLLPQLYGLHWLLATNYLQHAHADGRANTKQNKNYNYARNFYGCLNPLLLNIGYHTAHHEHSRAHWSQLPKLNHQYKNLVAPELHERSLLGYMLRTYILGIFHSRWRTISLHKKD